MTTARLREARTLLRRSLAFSNARTKTQNNKTPQVAYRAQAQDPKTASLPASGASPANTHVSGRRVCDGRGVIVRTELFVLL